MKATTSNIITLSECGKLPPSTYSLLHIFTYMRQHICVFTCMRQHILHICVNRLTILGSDNGLSPGRRQAII